MRSVSLVVFVLGCFLLANLLQCSIPKRTSLRFQEVTEEVVSDNSIGNSKLKFGSVGNRNLQANAITADKIDDSSIYQRHFSPNSVTAGAAAIELVHVIFRSENNVAVGVTAIPDLQESILPYESAGSVNSAAQSSPIVDNPARTTAYKVQGKARGPGTILGWYPAQNGHLLRYQASRALRAITCADVELTDLVPVLSCGCDTVFGTIGGFDCGCSAFWDHLVQADWTRDLTCASCTTPADICGQYSQLVDPIQYTDPQCNTYYPSERDPEQPDECFSFTSVEDVNNPQEGTPVYSPSVESIVIDNEGTVTISFFGRGIFAINTPDPVIDVIVVVLLNEQYGA